jgi:hypothetical protein
MVSYKKGALFDQQASKGQIHVGGSFLFPAVSGESGHHPDPRSIEQRRQPRGIYFAASRVRSDLCRINHRVLKRFSVAGEAAPSEAASAF